MTEVQTHSVAASPPPRLSQAQRRYRSEQKLIDAAMTLVAEHGSTRMTLAAVGERAGLSRGLVAHRFGSKAGLLQALAAAVGERFTAQMRAGPKRKGGMDALRGLFEHYFTSIAAGRTSSRALLIMMTESSLAESELGDSMVAFNRETLGFIRAQLRIGIQRKEIRDDIDIDGAAAMLMGILRGTMLHRVIDAQSLNPEATRDEAMRMLDCYLGGLRTENGIPTRRKHVSA